MGDKPILPKCDEHTKLIMEMDQDIKQLNGEVTDMKSQVEEVKGDLKEINGSMFKIVTALERNESSMEQLKGVLLGNEFNEHKGLVHQVGEHASDIKNIQSWIVKKETSEMTELQIRKDKDNKIDKRTKYITIVIAAITTAIAFAALFSKLK